MSRGNRIVCGMRPTHRHSLYISVQAASCAGAGDAPSSSDQVFRNSTSFTSLTCRLCLDLAANLMTACVETRGTCRRSSLYRTNNSGQCIFICKMIFIGLLLGILVLLCIPFTYGSAARYICKMYLNRNQMGYTEEPRCPTTTR